MLDWHVALLPKVENSITSGLTELRAAARFGHFPGDHKRLSYVVSDILEGNPNNSGPSHPAAADIASRVAGVPFR